MIILASIFLVCSIVLFILACSRVHVIKRRFRVNLAAFDRLSAQFDAKCKAYNELADCVAKAPLPDEVFKYPLCSKCARAYLNDWHICNEMDCMPLDKIDRDEMHEYEGFISIKNVAISYMANRLKPAVEKE